MQTLIEELNKYRSKLPEEQSARLSDRTLEKLYNVYPFNRFEYMISHLIAEKAMTIEQYIELRADYLERNRYLYLFEMAPRTFGQKWGEKHLMELIQDFKIPRTSLDPQFDHEYDLWLDGIRIEVKASRVVRKTGGDSLPEKALYYDSNLTEHFDMNFQQLKPGCCDVFIWIAVWRNHIDYWLLTADDVRTHPLFSNQHRASQLGEDGTVIEGQIHINNSNYKDFNVYLVRPDELRAKILALK